MFKHRVEVNGDFIQGEISTINAVEQDKKELAFNLIQYWATEGVSLNTQQLRNFALELNSVANEIDRLNGKNTLIRQ